MNFRDASGENVEYHRTNYKIINPKSITMTQLYGLFDPYTHEWSDGVLGGTFREMATATSQERKVLYTTMGIFHGILPDKTEFNFKLAIMIPI